MRGVNSGWCRINPFGTGQGKQGVSTGKAKVAKKKKSEPLKQPQPFTKCHKHLNLDMK